MDTRYYVHESVGRVLFDPRKNDPKLFEDWWALVICDWGIIDFYAWLLKKWGRPVDTATPWGPHISWIKGEEPTNKAVWGRKYPPMKFHYTNIVRCDNQQHAWVDVWCPKLHEIRAELGLKPRKKLNFHLTIGRLT